MDDAYDLVFVALGAVPLIPDIPGIEKALPFDYALEHPEAVVGDVVVIGGGEVGLECALQFVKQGHQAMCIEMKDILAAECPPVHFRRAYREMWESTPGFSWRLNSTVVAVGDGGEVTYVDAEGKESTVKADTVVVATGTRSLCDEALAFGGNEKFRLIGDCRSHGTIATAMRTAYFNAHNV